MHNGMIPDLELEGVELPQSTFYSNIPYADSTVNLLGQYVLCDSYVGSGTFEVLRGVRQVTRSVPLRMSC